MLWILIYLSITEYYWVWILSYITVLLQTAVKFQNDLAVLSFRFLRWSFIWYFVVFSTRLFSCDTSLLFSCSGTLCSSEFQPFWLRHQNPITVVLNCENLYGNHGRSVDPEGFFFHLPRVTLKSFRYYVQLIKLLLIWSWNCSVQTLWSVLLINIVLQSRKNNFCSK